MHLLRFFACVCAFIFAASPSAAEDWRIVQTAGVVKAGGSGFMPAAVQPNQALPGDSWVETGVSGRVVLVRGLETIALGPNSRVQLPSKEVNGNTQVLQTLGKALYQVGKQKAPHFQVDTPYLAAVVKGTTFIVSVGEAGSSVDVTEGLVLVTTPDGSDSEFVKPGFSGVVSKDNAGNVEVVQTAEAPAMKPASTPASDRASDTGKEHSAKDAGAKGSVITAAIGDVTLDIKAVSGGLASSIDPPANGVDRVKSDDAGASVDNAAQDKPDESAKDESSVAAVDVKADKTSTVDAVPANEPVIIDVGKNGADSVGGGGHGSDGGIDLSGGNNGGPGSSIVEVDLGTSTGGGPVGGSTGGAVGGGSGHSGGTGGSIDLGSGSGNGPSVGTGGGNSGGNGNSGGGGSAGPNANSTGGPGPRNAQ